MISWTLIGILHILWFGTSPAIAGCRYDKKKKPPSSVEEKICNLLSENIFPFDLPTYLYHYKSIQSSDPFAYIDDKVHQV